ncbi:MAG TPA: outer membrane lipoprotein carrier protein LolA [Terriglobales bacterium]|nr:outer membrane lipoprotein carrier protein LolA [Terriglobales bacterium]
MKLRPSSGRVFLCFLLYSMGSKAALSLPNLQSVVQAVDQHHDRLHTLQADFIEIYQGAGVERTESGTMWLKKTGKMRWEYRSPEEKLFICDGKDAWFYLPAEKQVRKSSLRSLEDLRSPLAFLLGKAKLEKELDGLSFAPDIRAWQPEDSMLRGVPRGMEDRVSQVLLEITPEYRISRILIHGVDDSVTEYRFSNFKEDLAIPDGRFRFVAPAGTETVNENNGE